MKKRIIAMLFVLLMILSLAACGGNTEDKPSNEAPSTTNYIREEKTKIAAVKDMTGFGISKLAKDRSYAYTASYYDDIQQVKELIKSGKTDIAAMNLADAVALFNEGADIKVIAVNNLASMYILTKGVDVSKPSDLKQHKVYALDTDVVTTGFMKTILSDSGADFDSLDIQIFANTEEIAEAINGKDKYVIMLTGVEAAKLPADEDRKLAVDLTLGWINLKESLPVHSVVVARTDYINSNPEIIDEFRMFNEVSVNYIFGNSESGALHLAETGMFDNAEIANNYIFNFSSLAYADNEKMKKVVTESIQAYIEGNLPADEFYYIG